MFGLEIKRKPKSKSKTKKSKRKLEFMQKIVIGSFLFFIICITASYVMGFLNRFNPLENLSIAIVGTPIAAVLSYALQNCSRAKWFGDKTADTKTEKKAEEEDV